MFSRKSSFEYGWLGKGITFDELPCTSSLLKSIRDLSDIYKRFVLYGFDAIILWELHAVTSKYEILNLAGSLWGAQVQSTWRQLLNGAKDDGMGG